MDRSDVLQLVIDCTKQNLAQAEVTPSEPLTGSTSLVGKNAVLDSLGLVQLIVDIELRLQLEHDTIISLADDRALSQKNSPFRTIDSLSDYIIQVMNE